MAIRAYVVVLCLMVLVWADQEAAPDLSTKQRVCIEVARDGVTCIMTIISPWNASLESDTAVSKSID